MGAAFGSKGEPANLPEWMPLQGEYTGSAFRPETTREVPPRGDSQSPY